MDAKTKSRTKASKRSSGFLRSIHRLPTKFVKDCGFIPIVLINTAAMVEKYIKTKEIFQTQGTLTKAYATLNVLSKGGRFRITRNLNVHDAVEAIKLVLTSLPEPLIPEDVCDSLITASRENCADQYGVILGKFRKKSPLNFGILHFMMILLRKVSIHTQHNLMDVRKLATIFVLDIIKPLKLDDPNDGEFLSERMQRLPYLIMVVEKLIINADIFTSARNLKSGGSVVSASNAEKELVFANAAGSGDSRGRVVERLNLNCSESARYSPRNITPPPNWASQEQLRVRHSSVPGSDAPNSVKTLVASGRETSAPARRKVAKSSKSVVTFGRDVKSQNVRHFDGHPSCLSPTRCCDSLTTLSSSVLRPPPHAIESKVIYQPNVTVRSPKLGSSSVKTSPKITEVNTSPQSYSTSRVQNGTDPPATKAQFDVPLPITKFIFPKANVKRDCIGKTGDKDGEKQQKQGRRPKPKAGSSPPSTRLERALSSINSSERKGSSPRKRNLLSKSKVNSFRDGGSRVPRTVVKRRSVSAGALDVRTRVSRSNSQGRRRRKPSLGRKRSGERSSDKQKFKQDDVMSPWVDEGMLSDDTSLMNRTIRNPRILPVLSSPEMDVPCQGQGRRSRPLERRSGRPLSKNSGHSLLPRPSSLELKSSPTAIQAFQLRANGPVSPLLPDISNAGKTKSVLPRVRLDSPERSTCVDNCVAELNYQSPMSNYRVRCGDMQQERERLSSESTKEVSKSSGSSGQYKLNAAKQERALIPQVRARDIRASKSLVKKPLVEDKKRELQCIRKSPRRIKSSVKQPDKRMACERLGLDQNQLRNTSVEFASMSSSQLTSEVSIVSKPARQKRTLVQQQQQQQQQQPRHLRRVDLQHLRQFRFQNNKWQQQLSSPVRTKRPNRLCSICNCVWSICAAVLLTCIGISLHLYLKAQGQKIP
ncbi:rho GTPase activating protein 22 [Elysia marginata]|uniref:Rho GTPase activating protein 22 n=1 Tax=Elysia marginata TaxID=1093978 RepID=A0AAV4GP32_9GAST|nr:rho GTPase activating protein 22 [Elysia marginata]